MNIQIYGKNKCFDTKKAERYFKERNIKFQYIDLLRYGLSEKEYTSVKRAIGGTMKLVDEQSKTYQDLYIANQPNEGAVEQKLLEHWELFKTPIVRNGKQATVGYQPEIWKGWE